MGVMRVLCAIFAVCAASHVNPVHLGGLTSDPFMIGDVEEGMSVQMNALDDLLSIDELPVKSRFDAPLSPEEVLRSIHQVSHGEQLAVCGEMDMHAGSFSESEMCVTKLDAIMHEAKIRLHQLKLEKERRGRDKRARKDVVGRGLEEEYSDSDEGSVIYHPEGNDEENENVAAYQEFLNNVNAIPPSMALANEDDVADMEYIAQGGFKVVYKGLYQGNVVAIAVASRDDIIEELVYQQAASKALPSCSAHVMDITAVYTPKDDPEYLAIIMPLTKGDLDARFDRLIRQRKADITAALSSQSREATIAPSGVLGRLARGVSNVADGMAVDKLSRRSALVMSAIQMSLGVRCAVKANIVHRDIKPANYMVLENEIVLHDFGVAAFGCSNPPCPSLAHFAGTYNYMPPYEPTAERSVYKHDIYALGVTFSELGMGSGRQLKQLVTRMMSNDAGARPDIEEVLSTLKQIYLNKCAGPMIERQRAVLARIRTAIELYERRQEEATEQLHSVQSALDLRAQTGAPNPSRLRSMFARAPNKKRNSLLTRQRDRYTTRMEDAANAVRDYSERLTRAELVLGDLQRKRLLLLQVRDPEDFLTVQSELEDVIKAAHGDVEA